MGTAMVGGQLVYELVKEGSVRRVGDSDSSEDWVSERGGFRRCRSWD